MSALRHHVTTVVRIVAAVVVAAGCASPAGTEPRATSGRTPPTPFASVAPSAIARGSGVGRHDHYRPPVSAPVVDGFRPPPGPFGAGNRGLEYDTEPGTPVGAIGAGRVVFAGSVGGSRHVTVLHADGLRSSYSYLETIDVALGDQLLGGQTVGRSTRRLHLGVRAGTAYLDPSLLFASGRVHLVPVR